MSDYLERRRARVAAAWSLNDEVVLVGAGRPIGLPGGADQTYPFRAHAEYFYLADREIPGGVVAFDPHVGWVDFVPDVTTAERVWEGKTSVPGTPLTELEGWLSARRGRPLVVLGSDLPALSGDAARAAELREALMHARRPKDDVELDRMRRAAAATAAGFATAHAMIAPASPSARSRSSWRPTSSARAGNRTAYDTIVGAGTNSAVLHFSPTARV
jgi:Xaa-Pro aminopeptidase